MMLLHQIPSALAITGATVVGMVAVMAKAPLDTQSFEIALIGGGAIVVAQFVIAISAGRQAKLAREAVLVAANSATNAALKAEQSGVKLDRISVSVDGRLTAATREIESLRGELARIYPADLRVQQQAENAKTDADIQAEASRRAQKLDAILTKPIEQLVSPK